MHSGSIKRLLGMSNQKVRVKPYKTAQEVLIRVGAFYCLITFFQNSDMVTKLTILYFVYGILLFCLVCSCSSLQ